MVFNINRVSDKLKTQTKQATQFQFNTFTAESPKGFRMNPRWNSKAKIGTQKPMNSPRFITQIPDDLQLS